MATLAEYRLAELVIQLPDPPTPFGAYVPAVQTGNLLFLSGMLGDLGPCGHGDGHRGQGP